MSELPQENVHIGKTRRGTARELRVVIDLIEKGWEVFNGIGVTSCDMIVMKDGELLRLESKSAFNCGEGIAVPNCTEGTFDVMAAVVNSGEIFYHAMRPCGIPTTREGYLKIYYAKAGRNGAKRRK